MALSAAFLVEGLTNPREHVVAYGATVDLEIASRAYNTISWSIVGSSLSTQSYPTITLGGSPLGKSASFPMPADPGDGLGRSFRVRCLVTDANGEEAVQYAIVGAVGASGRLPAPAGEGPNDRSASYGYTDLLNAALAGASASGRVQLHDMTHSPAGLWQFNETLNDISGNNFHFSLSAGATRYTEIFPGIRALQLLTTNRYTFATTGTALQHTGDITIESLLSLNAIPSGAAILAYDAVGETTATNTLYSYGINSDSLAWLSESASGTDATYNNNRLPPLGSLCHFAVRRLSNVIQFFVNGLPFGAASGTLATPTGGTTAFLSLGGAGGTTPLCALCSQKLILSGLSNAQIKAEYNRTLGGYLGVVA